MSQTVARMERDGLLTVEGDRHLQLSDEGRRLATAVMRKHRLAECLLVDVIGLDYADVHEEACRWEHVMSEAVERKLLTLLGHPTVSPFGIPIPARRPARRRAVGGETSAVLDSLTLLSTTAPPKGAPSSSGGSASSFRRTPSCSADWPTNGVRPGPDGARLSDGSVSLDGQPLPPGSPSTCSSAPSTRADPLEAAPLL